MKKLNKFFAVLVALAMMATLCVSMAFAADDDPSTTSTTVATKEKATTEAGTLGTTENSYLLKYFQIPNGVTAPAKQAFKFTFTKISDSANASVTIAQQAVAATTTMPAIPYQAEATDPNYVTVEADTVTPESGDAQSKYGKLNFATILSGVAFDHAGVYTYRVAETDESSTNTNIAYDNGTYLVHFYVTLVEKDDGEGGKTQVPEVTNITAEEEKTNDEGNPTGEGKGEKEKITAEDPVVEEKDDDDNPVKDDDDKTIADRDKDGNVVTEGLTFTNTLKEDNTGDIDTKNGDLGALGVKKTLSAVSDASKLSEFADTEFPFTIALTAAAGRETETLTAYIYDKDGNKTTTKYEFTGATSSQDFVLKQGEALVFETAPVGTTWTVTERLTDCTNAKKNKFNPSYAATNGTNPDTKAVSGTEKAGANLSTDVYTIHQVAVATEVASETVTVNKEVNKSIYDNKFDDELDTPTGILLSNLPYIVLALVAVGGLVAYVVVRRKADDEA